MDTIIVSIFNQCLRLEGLAHDVYSRFSEVTASGELRNFWIKMSEQERQHMEYWKQVLALAESGKVEYLFDEPEKLSRELIELEKKILEMTEDVDLAMDIESAILMTYRLEFLMLHPALTASFYLLRSLTGDSSPADNYADHIQSLIDILKKMGRVKSHFVLISELMQQNWSNSQRMAMQLTRIRELQGLVPICMHCKNVRNDNGYWEKVEKYVGQHIHVEFSHGICPDCVKKYYGDLVDKK